MAIKSGQTAWSTAKEIAGVEARWHDLRRSFISRIAGSQATDITMPYSGEGMMCTLLRPATK